MKNLARKDLLILSHMRTNGRERLTGISKKTRIPISTIYDKLKQFESEIIKGYTTLLDFDTLGYSTRAKICLRVDKSDRKEIQSYFLKSPEINTVYKINNGYDFMIETIFRSIKDLENYIETLEERFKVKQKQVYFIIEDIGREMFMANKETLDLVQ